MSEEFPKIPVAFEHKSFRSFPDMYFRRKTDGEVVAVVQLSEFNETVMALSALRANFGIEPKSPDDLMLNKVCQSLNYVGVLNMGEPLPTEITIGQPSWKTSDRHLLLSRYRLTLQLVSWVTKEEFAITTLDQVLMLMDNPNTKKNIARAFGDAAERLFNDRTNHEAVINRIETIAQQLAYLEALREVFDSVKRVDKKIQAFRKIYTSDFVMTDTINQVAKLSQLCVKKYTTSFETIDVQTGEIMPLLQNMGRQLDYIQKTCDDLYCRLRPWEDIAIAWDPVPLTRSNFSAKMIRELYQFLAPRYMVVDDWLKISKKQRKDGDRNLGGMMRW